MSGYIHEIKTTIPHSQREIKINVQGKNLILTGGNGCGKTQLLNLLYQNMKTRIVDRQNHDETQLRNNIQSFETQLKTMSAADSRYTSFKQALVNHEKDLELTRNPPLIINNIEQFVIRYHEKKALFLKFDATRQAQIKVPQASVSKEYLKQQDVATLTNSTSAAATLFEEFLVSNKTSQAYAESPSIENNPNEARKIKKWFDKLQADFRTLFEDNTLYIIFDAQLQAFFIKQDNKKPYRFQQLSSGFSSIISVYADLLTKVELRSIAPDEIDGVVFIDEIDAHLHVSLQRKIFSFLNNSFPKVQFIVTTHSPFVVSSVSDSVIYDLSRLEEVDDLSMYSYESVLEGLFNVLPISEILKNKIIKMNKITASPNPNIKNLETIVNDICLSEDKLDDESAFFLKKARITINKEKR